MSVTTQTIKIKQYGGAMLFSLLILSGFSIVVVSSLDSSSVTAKVTTVAQNKKLTFQSAETAIASSLNDFSLLNNAVLAGVDPAEAESKYASLPTSSLTSAKVEVAYVAENAVPSNYSLGGGFAAIHFKAIGRGTMRNNIDIESTNTQGFYRIVPSLH